MMTIASESTTSKVIVDEFYHQISDEMIAKELVKKGIKLKPEHVIEFITT